ncbi:MAG: tRNA preQ1(34) S-adenosylmethionine ribosyltransferase-isomerase QueA [Bryobacterales bacterium]|nr:tRNA preQ1(34) S-adenosylmethionine ribosyltransferase-isomerase QueA [Bryobacterales bacterium]
MQLSDFHYHLPEELIAQEPLAQRDASRMLVLDRGRELFHDSIVRALPGLLRPGDCLVLNNTRVFPSRLLGRREGIHALSLGIHNPRRHQHLSGEVEVFLTHRHEDDPLLWEALVRPGRKLPVGERIHFAESLVAEIVGRGEFGERTVRFQCPPDELMTLLEEYGHVPLPPYIRRGDRPGDHDRYQTVFARSVDARHREPGSVAAPTAGLHFTPELLSQCKAAGAVVAEVTLHVGLGTFQPLREQQVEANHLHEERYYVSAEAADQINSARRRIAVGTTSARTMETVAREGRAVAGTGDTSLFIYPGYRFQLVDAMLTNFHLPESSLLMLVSAFAGREFTLAAYSHAVEQRYRFFSYGDCMFIA